MATIKSAKTTIVVSPKTTPKTGDWMYFRGNGHTSGRNGPYDQVNVQRSFFISALDNGVDQLKWLNGFSLCWQIIPVRQAAYYTTFFYSASQGTDFYDLRDTYGYVGCHPYPYSAFGGGDGEDFTRHKWEISVDGGDGVGDLVNYGQVHTQAFTCHVLNQTSGRSMLRFFTNITSTTPADQHTIEGVHEGAYALAPPHPYKAMVFGDAPWWRAHQHERLSGYIRRIKIFSGELTDEELLQEASSDSLVTTAGQKNVWWAKINASSPDDLTSDFAAAGNIKRVGQWADSARCEIITAAQLPTHHAMVSPATIGDTLHLERG